MSTVSGYAVQGANIYSATLFCDELSKCLNSFFWKLDFCTLALLEPSPRITNMTGRTIFNDTAILLRILGK